MKTIVICGKGGIGKSTITSNLAVRLQGRSLRVLQIGCDPKHDSCARHLDNSAATVMDSFAEKGTLSGADLEGHVLPGRSGVHCLEIGGPEPGIGCAGRAISLVLELIAERPMFFLDNYDVRIFDLLGDVVCGGFAAPMRTGKDTEIYLVVSGGFLPLYAANNIARGVINLSRRGGGRVAGVIANQRSPSDDADLIKGFAAALGTRVVGWIPHDPHIHRADIEKQTVVERFPDSPAAKTFDALADRILETEPKDLVIPTPLSDEDLEEQCRRCFRPAPP